MSRVKDEWFEDIIEDMIQMQDVAYEQQEQMDFDFRSEADKKLGIDVKKMVDIVAKDANIDSMEVHVGVRLRDRALLYASYRKPSKSSLFDDILATTRPERTKHVQSWSGTRSNTLTGTSVKWMNLDCVVPVYPLSP